jgi:hypothetical protein
VCPDGGAEGLGAGLASGAVFQKGWAKDQQKEPKKAKAGKLRFVRFCEI